MIMKIATVYGKSLTADLKSYAMDTILWQQISLHLSYLGHEVDLILNTRNEHYDISKNLHYLSVNKADWADYDIIVVFFHDGFGFLREHGGNDHPFIVSHLGSIVGPSDKTEGVYFFGKVWQKLFNLQAHIHNKSKMIMAMTPQSVRLWKTMYGEDERIFLSPTGVEKDIPAPSPDNPYQNIKEKVAVYIGNIYQSPTQREVNLFWQNRLNRLGKRLLEKGIRLCRVGPGDTDRIDRKVVAEFGPVNHENVYDYHFYADVGIALAQGEVQHNESSKIYYYLRTGLPVVSEKPIPNNYLIKKADCGFIVDYNEDENMVDKIEQASQKEWNQQSAMNYMIKHHTWHHRIATYQKIIAENSPTSLTAHHNEKRLD